MSSSNTFMNAPLASPIVPASVAPSNVPEPPTVLHKAILSLRDLERFKQCDTYQSFVDFIIALNNSAIGVKINDECHISNAVQSMLDVLSRLKQWIDETPAAPVGLSRFGNVAFRSWMDQVRSHVVELMNSIDHSDSDLCNNELHQASLREIECYFLKCFGDYERIDYGTGHEAHFIAWLYCWKAIGVVSEVDYTALVTRVFERYIRLMRQLQFKFWLEPAGSHGVWGLDDYHFLPFMFGSAQLATHAHLRPLAIHNADFVEQFAPEYMYFACIQFINSIKTTASLRWHSPMLDDISGVKTWKKINEGMIKMYQGDVLGKLPIMQHFLFGSLLPFEHVDEPDDDDNDQNAPHNHGDHQHHHHQGANNGTLAEGEAPSCCPRIPSAIAAQQNRRAVAIPFD